MKNIYLIPTPKPSRLYLIKDKLKLSPLKFTNNVGWLTQHVYITSDEEIKEGDWVFDIFKNAYPVIRQLTTKEEVLGVQKTELKIILTDNKDLIKDGVQAIDDNFLEWFVKNPSCEFVEIKKGCKIGCDKFILNGVNSICCEDKEYKIIIPQEEPKQEIISSEEDAKIFVDALENPPAPNEKLKTAFEKQLNQETLEEAAERYYEDNIDESNIPREHYEWEIQDLMIGFAYQWQQEQDKKMYSVHDLKVAFFKGCKSERQIKPRQKCWEEFIEQFKKK